jgi:hypothetical protein
VGKRKDRIEQQPTPVSGERVMMPPARSTYAKPPGPLSDDEKAQIKGATAQRKAWEKSPVGQERTRSGDNGLFGPGANKTQVYAMNAGPAHDPGPRHYDVQLPGMVDPNAAPRPPKWEELSDAHRAHAERSLAKYGTSVQQMSKDYGAQLDQAHKRAWDAGESRPWSEDFYTVGEPRKVLDQSARDLGIPATIHAQMNAFTSPNTKFQQESRGETVYPNDRAATHAVKWVQQGGKGEDVPHEFAATGLERTPGEKYQGYPKNMVKAAKSFEQWKGGTPPADWKTGASGDSGPFDSSPKTGPYANSWSDSHPQFFVSDVHSGGGGGLPHLGTDKAVRTATGEQLVRDGKKVATKSQREEAIASVPYFHSAMDYAARQAHNERGISHVRSGQAAQWGEEQIQRRMKGGPTHDKVYPPRSSAGAINPDQLKMF